MSRVTFHIVIALLLMTWLGSLFLPIWVPLGSSKRFLRVLLSDGAVTVRYGGTQWSQERLTQSARKWWSGIRREDRFSRWGFSWQVYYDTPLYVWPNSPAGKTRCVAHRVEHRVQIPAWIVVLLLLYPAFVLIRAPLRRIGRRRRGLCIRCAYDLTGNTSGVCPECAAKMAG